MWSSNCIMQDNVVKLNRIVLGATNPEKAFVINIKNCCIVLEYTCIASNYFNSWNSLKKKIKIEWSFEIICMFQA